MEWMRILKKAAEEVQTEVLPLFGSPEASKTFGQGAGGDLIKKIDLVAENAIVDVLKKNQVSCILISEESGVKRIGEKSEYYVIVDPVDGTTNATRNIPFFATSLAVADGPRLSRVKIGLVMDLYHGSTFLAEKGEGATYNTRRMLPSSISKIEEAFIGADLNKSRTNECLKRLAPLLAVAKNVRHFGANALEVCYVATGFSDAFIDIRNRLRVTDMAAAHLILKEAGGTVVTLEGSELEAKLTPTERISFIAAANPTLCKKILEMLI